MSPNIGDSGDSADSADGVNSVEPVELLRRVRTLDLVARRNAAALVSGAYVTSIPGQGMLFHETRKYVAGESARRIDWNITARVGEPHVRVHLEERQREIFVAVDVSPSMHVGFQERTKLEYAIELAATLGASAIESGDRLGFVFFADRVLAASRPRGGRKQLYRFLRTALEQSSPWKRPVGVSDPRSAVHAIQHHRGRFVVFLISDFIDHDVPEDLRYLRERHDVSLLHVFDPFEYAEQSSLVLRGRSPEARGSVVPVRPGATGQLAEMKAFLRREAARYRISTVSLPTTEPPRSALGRAFHQRRRRRYR